MEPVPWHRLFGLSLTDFFDDSPYTVEVEKDLSVKQQLLDVVVIRREMKPWPCELPDGFEDLANHNLVTFKSHQQAMNGWALNELVGHYVNYRKQISPTMRDLLPERDFRLFAVCARSPEGLARGVQLTKVSQGVYETRHFTGVIRLIVANELRKEKRNALLHLFSASEDLVQFGEENYRLRTNEMSTVMRKLRTQYRLEGFAMAITLAEFAREQRAEMLREMSTEERMKGLPAEERMKGLPAEERMKGLPVEERIKGLSASEICEGLNASPELLAAVREKLNENDLGSRSE